MEAAASVTIASLERTSFALSFDANNSNFFRGMYLFPEQVTCISYVNLAPGGARTIHKRNRLIDVQKSTCVINVQ